MNSPRRDFQRHLQTVWDEALLPGLLLTLALLFAAMVISMVVPHGSTHDRVHLAPQQYSGTVCAEKLMVPNTVPVLSIGGT